MANAPLPCPFCGVTVSQQPNRHIYHPVPDQFEPWCVLAGKGFDEPQWNRRVLDPPTPAAPAPHEDTVRLPEEGACERCHQPNPLCWFTKIQYWNTVTATHPFSFLCPTCFIALAKDVGIDPTAWELVPESLRAADLLAQPPVRSEETGVDAP